MKKAARMSKHRLGNPAARPVTELVVVDGGGGRHRPPPSHRGRYLAATGLAAVASIAVLTDGTGVPPDPGSTLARIDSVTPDEVPPPQSTPADEPARVPVVRHAPTEISYTATDSAGIPALALLAYRRAAERLAAVNPGCHLPMALIAAIGKVESNHARGGRVDPHGTAVEPILGPVLNGGAYAAIPDTDGGRYDGEVSWDRAVGPMQFIPSTWAAWRADGNGDGRADPENLFDASLAAANYLCARGRDIGTEAGTHAAILSYNNSESYLRLVLAWQARYSGSVVAIPATPGVPARSGSIPTAPPAPVVTESPAPSPVPAPPVAENSPETPAVPPCPVTEPPKQVTGTPGAGTVAPLPDGSCDPATPPAVPTPPSTSDSVLFQLHPDSAVVAVSLS